jgi:hypothetical protein
MSEVYYEEQPREDIGLYSQELDPSKVIEQFEKHNIGNDRFLRAVAFHISTENQMTSLSDTNENVMRKIALKSSTSFVRMIALEPEKYGLRIEEIPFVGNTFAKLSYQLAMKSVGGGERAYRGKIIRIETKTETKEESSGLNIPLKK